MTVKCRLWSCKYLCRTNDGHVALLLSSDATLVDRDTRPTLLSYPTTGAHVCGQVRFLPAGDLSNMLASAEGRTATALMGTLLGLAMGLSLVTTGRKAMASLQSVPADELLSMVLGLAVGLLVSDLALAPFSDMQLPEEFFLMRPLAAITVTIAIIQAVVVGMRKNVPIVLQALRFARNDRGVSGSKLRVVPDMDFLGYPVPMARGKLIDTSALVDGRVEYVMEYGFLEGELIIPGFVLAEMQAMADSTTPEKREKGRRGLDTLARLQQLNPDRLRIGPTNVELQGLTTQARGAERDNATIPVEVDAALIWLAKRLNYGLVTLDYNLQQIAQMQGIVVFNINEFSKAITDVIYCPGDRLLADVASPLDETEHAICYLQDGVMVIVEGAAPLVGQEVPVVIVAIQNKVQDYEDLQLYARLELPGEKDGYSPSSGPLHDAIKAAEARVFELARSLSDADFL
eukprot:jgi/Mesvir1/26041/Mv09584-RA.2